MTEEQLTTAVTKLRRRVTELEATQAGHNLVTPLEVDRVGRNGWFRARHIKYRMGKLPWS